MLVVELLMLLCVGAALAPDSPLGRWLIHKPAKALAQLTPRKAAVGLISAALVLAFLVAAPELVGIFGLLDFSLLMDVAALSLLMGTGARLAAVRAAAQRLPLLAGRLGRALRRRRRVRARSQPRVPARADDPDGPAWAFA